MQVPTGPSYWSQELVAAGLALLRNRKGEVRLKAATSVLWDVEEHVKAVGSQGLSRRHMRNGSVSVLS